MDSPSHRQLPPMPGFQPGMSYRPGGPIPSNAAFQAQLDQLAMLSKMPQAPGLYGATGFFPDQVQSGGSALASRWLRCSGPVQAGTWDRPFAARGRNLTWDFVNERFTDDNGELIDFYNPFPNLSAVTDGLVLAIQPQDNLWIMIWGSC